METIYSLIDGYNLPILTAFLIGVLTSISPCPLATNITAIAYISKDTKNPQKTVVTGLFYTLGRAFSYTVLAWLIYFGFSSFQIAGIFQGWGDKVLGPVLIFIGLVMFGFIRINLNFKNGRLEEYKEGLLQRGYFGSFLLGAVFALALCPYSGALFFGMLIPLVLRAPEGLVLPLFFAFGTGLPVIVFSILIAVSLEMMGRAFRATQKIEKVIRYAVASVFVLTGVYYLKYLFIFLPSIFR